jgi:hypothetical protein
MEAVSMDARLKIVKILSFGNDANLGRSTPNTPGAPRADGLAIRVQRTLVKLKTTTLNQNGEPVQIFVGNLIVPRRSDAH